MKTIHKLFLIATIALGLGFVACNDSEVVSQGDNDSNANTHVSVTLSLHAKTRALPDDYNDIGKWGGKDKIETIAVYLVDGSSVTAKVFNVGPGLDYEFTQSTGQLVPKKEEAAIRTTAGEKKVYVLINGKPEVVTHLNKTPVAEFEDAYQKVALKLDNDYTTATPETSASKIAVKNGVDNETIVMTNVNPATLTVLPNITAAETIAATPKNRVSLEVERAVARVMVTKEKETYIIPDPNTDGATNLGTISDITWVVAQGENKLYVQRKSNWNTPSFDWIPTASNYVTQAEDRYDYSGLFEERTNKNHGGTDVPHKAAYGKDLGKITAELDAQLSGKFVLPTTHEVATGTASSFKKGNTAYVLIRAKFTPEAAAFADGVPYTEGNDFYVGANGKFYTSAVNALLVDKGGVEGQTVARYKDAKVLYYAWLNPDEIPDWYNSPVLRNNIYHIHITGFKNLGTNWNPLFPEDPENPTLIPNPEDPTGPQIPSNPDPKPEPDPKFPTDPTDPDYPEEPTNPIDPEDPLTTPITYMSVDVTVLQWLVHSYNVDLGI